MLIPFRFLLILLLLAGCRSEKVAFQFRPAPAATAVEVDTPQHSGAGAVRAAAINVIQNAAPSSGPAKQLASNRSKLAKYNYRIATQAYPFNERLAHGLLPLKTGSESIASTNFRTQHLTAIDKNDRPLIKNGIDINNLLAYIGLGLYAVGIIVGVIIGGSTGFMVGAIIFGIGGLLFGLGFGGVK